MIGYIIAIGFGISGWVLWIIDRQSSKKDTNKILNKLSALTKEDWEQRYTEGYIHETGKTVDKETKKVIENSATTTTSIIRSLINGKDYPSMEFASGAFPSAVGTQDYDDTKRK